jgi:predicted NBD/HSP70 family sugar kinase
MERPPVTSSAHLRVREFNDRRFCELLTEQGPLTRTALARAAGVSKPSALEVIDRLMAEGLVVETGLDDVVRRGPKAAMFGLSPTLGLATGVEVTGREISVRHRTFLGEPVGEDHRTALRDDVELDEQILAAVGQGAPRTRYRHWAVVVALLGAVDPVTGDVLFARDLPGWHEGIAAAVRRGVRADVSFDNEVNLRATAELRTGVATDVSDVLLLALGGGVGAALVLDGRERRGAHGAAGEIGFLPVAGDQGYQEVAGAWTLAHAVGTEHTTDFAWVHDLVAKEPEGGPGWAAVARALGDGLVGMVTVVDPQVVVLAGEVSRIAGEPLRQAVEAHLAGRLPWTAPEVRVSRLGNEAVLSGALLRAAERLRHLAFPGNGTQP